MKILLKLELKMAFIFLIERKYFRYQKDSIKKKFVVIKTSVYPNLGPYIPPPATRYVFKLFGLPGLSTRTEQ